MGLLILLSACFLGYLIGAIPTGLIIGLRFRGIDIREHGSKNIGFTNAVRVLGKGLGIPVLIIDVAKAYAGVCFLAWFTEGLLEPQTLAALFAAVIFLGNLFNLFLGFKGGKGIATGLGVFLAIATMPVLIALGCFLIILVLTRYVSLGSITASIALPVSTLMMQGMSPAAYMAILAGVFAIYKHRSNISRLLNGTENKLGSKKAEV